MNYPFGGKIDYDFVKNLYTQHGYLFYDFGPYNVNIAGFRSKSIDVNKFNDLITYTYLDQFENKNCLVFAATTKPGLTYLKDKLGSKDGTAILVPGYYAKCWKIGKHNAGNINEHDALQQNGTGAFKVWRDNNSDGKLDYSGKLWDNVTGLNLHTTRDFEIQNVGGFSAACQVVQDDKEHFAGINIVKRSYEIYKNDFSYALFQEK